MTGTKTVKAIPLDLPSGRVEPQMAIDDIAVVDSSNSGGFGEGNGRILCAEVTGRFAFPDGMKPYAKIWKSSVGPTKARVLFVHGFADHCETYPILFGALASYGITVIGYDKRGWGRTAIAATKANKNKSGKDEKGLIGTTDGILEDINAVLEHLLDKGSGGLDGKDVDVDVPLFLIGHSMGGGEILTFASRGKAATRARLRGYAAEAPFVAFPAGQEPSRLLEFVGRVAARLTPDWKMTQKPVAENVCRDPEVCDGFKKDKLCWGTCSYKGLAELLDRTSDLAEGRVVMRESTEGNDGASLWIGHGSGDKVTDYAAAKKWFDRVEVNDKKWKTYEGWYHKLHAEPNDDKLEFARDLAEWVLTKAALAREAKL